MMLPPLTPPVFALLIMPLRRGRLVLDPGLERQLLLWLNFQRIRKPFLLLFPTAMLLLIILLHLLDTFQELLELVLLVRVHL